MMKIIFNRLSWMLRYFSSAGYIVNKTRSSLDPNTEHARVSAGLVPLTLKFQFSIPINNFELTGHPFKHVKLDNLIFSSLTINY